jgi:hypothetical protein
MPKDNAEDQPTTNPANATEKSQPHPGGICPKCQNAATCRRYETENGPVWYCVRFDVTVSE